MSLVLIKFHLETCMNHMQILTEKTWSQPQGVKNREMFFLSFNKQICY